MLATIARALIEGYDGSKNETALTKFEGLSEGSSDAVYRADEEVDEDRNDNQ